MGYKAIVNSNIKLAFNLLKDLATPAILSKKDSASFDFENASAVIPKGTTISTKIVIVSSDKKMEKSNLIVSEILMKTKDIGELSFYDTVTINGQVWSLGQVVNSDGYITLLQIFKEK